MSRETAFVDVDTQFDFMDPGGALYVPGAEKLAPALERLTRWAVDKGVPIIASVDAHAPDDPEFKDFPPHCVAGTPGQKKLHETLGNRPLFIENRPLELSIPMIEQAGVLRYDQYVFEKQTFSLFGNVNAEKILGRIAPRKFVVYGVATDYCVKAIVLDLLEQGAEVEVVEDAIAAVAEESGLAALEEMKAKGARFVSVEDVLR
jgi:nicotinamidase/pyrazinamidase